LLHKTEPTVAVRTGRAARGELDEYQVVSEEGLKKAGVMAKELGFKKLTDKKAKEVNKKIEAQDDSAATGLGMIFD
jgi:hypothetical protein